MPTTPADARKTFPATENLVYLDAAAVSLISQPVYDAIRSFLDICIQPGSADASRHHLVMDQMRHRAIEEAAVLLNARGRPDRPGGKHHPRAQHRGQRHPTPGRGPGPDRGYGVPPGVHSLEDERGFRRGGVGARPIRSQRRTSPRIISRRPWTTAPGSSASPRSSGVPGHRIDLGALGDLCRSRDIYLVVDAIQQLGACPLDVQETPVDFLMAGGHKWLNAPFGCGILYVSPDRIRELDPESWGYLALEHSRGWVGRVLPETGDQPLLRMELPADGHQVRDRRDLQLPRGGGPGSLPGADQRGGDPRHPPSHPGSRRPASVGTGAAGGTARLPGTVRRRPGRASPSSPCTTHPEKDRALLEELLARKIYLAQRYTSGIGGIRASTHFYNDEEDVDALLNAIEELAT